MAVYFKVLAKNESEFCKAAKIAEDCGAFAAGHWLDSSHVRIECLSHDDSQALREIYRELGYQTQKVYS